MIASSKIRTRVTIVISSVYSHSIRISCMRLFSSVLIAALLVVLPSSHASFGPSISLGGFPSTLRSMDVIPLNPEGRTDFEYVLVGLGPDTFDDIGALMLVKSDESSLTVVDKVSLSTCNPRFFPINPGVVLFWCAALKSTCGDTLFATITVKSSPAPRIHFINKRIIPGDDSHCWYYPFPGPFGVHNPAEGVWFGGKVYQGGSFIYNLDIDTLTLTTTVSDIFNGNQDSRLFSGTSSASGSLIVASYKLGDTLAVGSINGSTGEFINQHRMRSSFTQPVVATTADQGFYITTAERNTLKILNWNWDSWKEQGEVEVPDSTTDTTALGFIYELTDSNVFISAFQPSTNNGTWTLSQVVVADGAALRVEDQTTAWHIGGIKSLRGGNLKKYLYVVQLPSLLIRYEIL